jgi:hypothetical protein
VRALLLWFVAAVCSVTSLGLAADVPSPAIRDFEIATLEKFGREIFDQQQLHAKAADLVKDMDIDGVRGWIASPVDGKQRIRFVGGDGKPEALVDIVFDGATIVGQVHGLVPSDRTLTVEETAQFEARALALSNASNKCSKTTTTAALKDSAGDGWIVWALATSGDDDAMIVGGHVRFTISADGRRVVQRDNLSKGCIAFSRREMAAGKPAGGSVAGMMLVHLVSMTPVETHVYAQLAYQMNIVVGTRDGRAWMVDGGRIAGVDMDMAGYPGAAARLVASFTERCSVIAKVLGEDPPKFVLGDAPSLILATESGPFKMTMPSGYEAVSVICGRLDIVPAPNDYKAVVSGLSVRIVDVGAGHPDRMGLLEMADGQFRFTIEKGAPLTDDLVARVDKRLAGFQKAVQEGKTVSLMSAPKTVRAEVAGYTPRVDNAATAGVYARSAFGRQVPVEAAGLIKAVGSGFEVHIR